MRTLMDPGTPYALVDVARVDHNVARVREHLDRLGVPLRLHVKTAKSLDLAARVFPEGPGPITVSTLAEAEYFADGGYTDMIYAVGIAPHKLDRVVALRRRGVDLAVLLDSLTQVDAVTAASREAGLAIPALVEIDCDGHRGGIHADDPLLLDLAQALVEGGAELRGVLDHAGESYHSIGRARVEDAERERASAVDAARRLRGAGHDCPVVSVGSTPTALAAAWLGRVTEVRAGNFVFFDLVMAGIGVCDVDDIALSVVVTVIGHRRDKGWIITDGGWMATSRDRGTASQPLDQGYGLVADIRGRLIPDLLMTDATQEHGRLTLRPGIDRRVPDLPIGTRLRILPNHACATAAQHSQYVVTTGGRQDIEHVWPRHNGW